MRPDARLSRFLAIPAVTLAFASGAAAAGRVPVVSTIAIDNFGEVNEHYYRGAQPKPSDFADLAALGIKTVIDLTGEGDAREAGLVQTAGMSFFRIPMTTRETPSKEKVARFLTLVNDPAHQPVYVHCQGGRHRTGVMTAVYRMSNDRWTAADFLHPEFKQFVYSYEPEMPTHAPGAVSVGGVSPASTMR